MPTCSCESKRGKCIFFVCGIFFTLKGFFIFVHGVSVLDGYARYSQYIGAFYWLTPFFSILIGLSVCIVSAYILCYLGTERWWKPWIFPAFFVLLLLPICTNKEIASHTRDPDYRKVVAGRLRDYLKDYNTDEGVRHKWDVYQAELHCCGIDGPNDWWRIFGNETLPASCCWSNFFRKCEQNFVKTPKGCVEKLLDLYAISLDGVASFVRSMLDPTTAF